VTAVVLLRPASADAGQFERLLADVRRDLAERLLARLRDAGVVDRRLVAGPADDTSFGGRLRTVIADVRHGSGVIVAGAGSAALARLSDLAPFVVTASSGRREARANNRYSSDLLAIGDASVLGGVPDLPSDNALPRWLDEVAGVPVADERRRWRLQFDVDSLLDVALLGGALSGLRTGPSFALVQQRLDAVAAALANRRSEVVVAGRTSPAALAWLERRSRGRIRAIVEERGLRASSALAMAEPPDRPRPPRSVLGAVLDDRGPEALGAVLAELGEAALVDSRVLLAHRLGANEGRWPSAEDRFASDLLLAESVTDPWLRALTLGAREASIPVVLGGHSLVGPGVRLVARRRAAAR
jgi:hypothetical protein